MKSKISFIGLGVNDISESLAFYQKLGFEPHNYKEGDEHIMFELEGSWMSLFPREKLAADATVSPEGSGFPGFTIAHNEPSKADVDRVIEEARAAGAKIVKEPQDAFWGGYSAYFKDPNGYLWEIAFNPFTDLT